ncbi:MAG: hypothetical protein RJS97_23355 [Parvibaculaceae bacterium]
MATTVYFEETVHCQGGEATLELEFGRSSYFEEDSIYLNVNGSGVVMDRATAKKFVEAAQSVGHYFGLLE